MAKKQKNTSLSPSNTILTSDRLSKDEKTLFSDAMNNVTRQSSQRIAPDQRKLINQNRYTGKSTPKAKTTLNDPSDSISNFVLTDHNGDDPVSSETVLKFSKNGVQPRQLKRLRLGQYAIDESLDLHGTTIAIARKQVTELLQSAYSKHWRCIHIIHGCSRSTPYPALKNQVNYWLRQHPYVLAFHSCPPTLGGNGAVLVLLHRVR